VAKDSIMNFIAEWKNVEKDGLPEPDDNKIYFVLYSSGCGSGTYDYDTDMVEKDPPYEYGRRYDYIKTDRPVWYLDFDSVGHADEITDYFEIIYPWDCKKEN